MINVDLFKHEIEKLGNEWEEIEINNLEGVKIVKTPSNKVFLTLEIEGIRKKIFIGNLFSLHSLFSIIENKDKLLSIMEVIEEVNKENTKYKGRKLDL